MSRIYLASSWRNAAQPDAVEALRLAGHEVYDFRNPPEGIANGFRWSEIDPEWEAWSAACYREMLQTPLAQQGFRSDFDGMRWADTGILLLPCGRSAHLELGWMAGAGKRTIVWTRDGEEPELMALLASHICVSLDEVLRTLNAPVAPPASPPAPRTETALSEKDERVILSRELAEQFAEEFYRIEQRLKFLRGSLFVNQNDLKLARASLDTPEMRSTIAKLNAPVAPNDRVKKLREEIDSVYAALDELCSLAAHPPIARPENATTLAKWDGAWAVCVSCGTHATVEGSEEGIKITRNCECAKQYYLRVPNFHAALSPSVSPDILEER